MHKVYGEVYGDKGDCLRACIASLLEKSADEVPNLAHSGPERTWLGRVRRYLKSEGFSLVIVEIPSLVDPRYYPPGANVLVVGKHEVGHKNDHACIYRDGKLVHDPNTADGYGLTAPATSDMFDVYLIVPLFDGKGR